MKKILLPTLICLLVSIKASSQNAYYDALFCASLNEVDADTNSYESFSFNGGDKKVLSDFKLFLKDPFKSEKPNFERVKGIFQKIKASEQISDRASGLAGLELVSLLAPIFNLSKMSSGQTDTLLYGLTIYLADEFRRGYMQTYMNTVKNTIGKSGELQVLFPTTYQKILTFDPLRYKDFGNEMKGVYDEDLGNSLDNLIKHIENETPDEKLTYLLLNKTFCKNLTESENYPYLNLTATMGQKLINGVHPSDILGYLDEKYYKPSSIKATEKTDTMIRIGQTLHLLNILQRNLRDTATRQNNQFSNVWLNFEKLSKLNNPKASKYFLALIQKEDVSFFNSSSTNYKQDVIFKLSLSNDILKNQCDALRSYYITPILSILTKLDELTKLKDKSLLEEKNFQMYFNNVGELIDLVATNFNQRKKRDVRKIINLTSNIFQIYNAVRVKNYSNLPVYLSSVLSNLSEPKDTTNIRNLIKSVDNLSSFSAGIVSAKTSDDVNKVIKNYASPPASFIEKRNGTTLTLGAMPGLYFAYEKLDTTGASGFQANVGLSLPLGLDLSFPLCPNKNNNRASLGVFFQAIDLGAMLNYRLNSSANTLPDKVGFAAIFSPGISLSYGFPQSPWSIQVGYQRGPELRKISKDGNGALFPSDRWQIRFAYDIPLLRIK